MWRHRRATRWATALPQQCRSIISSGGRLRPHGGGSVQDMILGKGIGIPADIRADGSRRCNRRAGCRKSIWQADPRDQNALLALCIVEGVERDALVLLYKRWMAGLKHAQGGESAGAPIARSEFAGLRCLLRHRAERVRALAGPGDHSAVCQDSGGGWTEVARHAVSGGGGS